MNNRVPLNPVPDFKEFLDRQVPVSILGEDGDFTENNSVAKIVDPVALLSCIDNIIEQIQDEELLLALMDPIEFKSLETGLKMTTEEYRSFFSDPSAEVPCRKDNRMLGYTREGIFLAAVMFGGADLLTLERPNNFNELTIEEQNRQLSQSYKINIQSNLLQSYLNECVSINNQKEIPAPIKSAVSLHLPGNSAIVTRLREARESIKRTMTPEQLQTYAAQQRPDSKFRDNRESLQEDLAHYQKRLEAKYHKEILELYREATPEMRANIRTQLQQYDLQDFVNKKFKFDHLVALSPEEKNNFFKDKPKLKSIFEKYEVATELKNSVDRSDFKEFCSVMEKAKPILEKHQEGKTLYAKIALTIFTGGIALVAWKATYGRDQSWSGFYKTHGARAISKASVSNDENTPSPSTTPRNR